MKGVILYSVAIFAVLGVTASLMAAGFGGYTWSAPVVGNVFSEVLNRRFVTATAFALLLGSWWAVVVIAGYFVVFAVVVS